MIKPWWDLKTSLATELGKTLIHWSKNMNSYPPDLTEDEWRATLYMHGVTLLRYGKGRYDYHEVESDVISKGFFVDEGDLAEIEAKHSMVWVAENFYTLWD